MNGSSSPCCTQAVAAIPKAEEVACCDCGLDPICQLLDYAEPGSGVEPGILIRRRFIQAGGMLFDAGGAFESLYAVKSGSLKAVVTDAQGQERVVGFYLTGELIGADAMASQQYNCSVRALEPSQVCDLRLHRLSASGRPIEAIQQAIIDMLGKAVAFDQLIISSLIKQNSEQRLAAFLVTLSQRLQARGFTSKHFRLSMSRSDIASYLGLARETVSRLLTRFQKDGLIALRRKHLTLLKPDGLADIAASM